MCYIDYQHSFSLLTSGIRLFDDDVWSTDATESKALNHELESVDIYSNSWGPGDMSWQIEGPGPLTRKALKRGIETVWYIMAFTFSF